MVSLRLVINIITSLLLTSTIFDICPLASAHCVCDGDYEPITETNQVPACSGIASSECKIRSIANRCCKTCKTCDGQEDTKPDDGSTTAEKEKGDCFPAEAMVVTPDGPLRMDELADKQEVKVLTMEADGSLLYAEPLIWVHKSTEATEFLELTTRSGYSLRVSKTHFVYRTDCDSSQDSPKVPVFAREIALGDCLMVYQNGNQSIDQQSIPIDHQSIQLSKQKRHAMHGTLMKDQVTTITKRRMPGKYQFTTETGTVIVDNVLASTYSIVDYHWLQHTLFTTLHRVLWVVKAVMPERLARVISSDGIDPISDMIWQTIDSSTV